MPPSWRLHSWYVIESSAEKNEAIDFLNEIYAKDNDFYEKILVNQGAVGSLLAARNGPAYSEKDAFFGGEPAGRISPIGWPRSRP